MITASHPMAEIIADPQIVGATTALVIALLSYLALKLKHMQARLKQQLDAIQKDASTTKEQTTNNHGSNLRDDIDQIRVEVRELGRQTRDGLNAVRAAQDREHTERVDDSRLIREELGRLREDLQDQHAMYHEHLKTIRMPRT